MDWNCTLTEERLSEYLEGALAAEEREACEAHVAACAKCAAMLESVSALVGQMHALEPVREPAFLARRVIRATAGSRTQRHELASASGWFNLIWQPRFAMGIATVAATFVILAHAAGARLSNLKPSDLNPVHWAREGNRQAHLTYARGEKFVNDLRVVYEIRAMLATPETTPETQKNQTAPAPNGARPDTGEHSAPGFERDANARTASSKLDWAMLNLAFGGTTPDSANRRSL
jgi:hypothetical protein